jgi:hypothetical protein
MESAQWDFIKTTLGDLKEDQKYLRDRLDQHIDDEDQKLNSIRKDVTCVKVAFEGHKTKLTLLLSGVAAAISVGVSILLDWFGKGTSS